MNKSNKQILTKWRSMLKRVYSELYHLSQPTYHGCSLAEEWYNFDNFKEWCFVNLKDYMEGWQLDKDILFKGNKIYSPENCCFVPQEINSLFTKSTKTRGDYPIGVSKAGVKFEAKCRVNGVKRSLGRYNSPEEAFQVYKEVKENYIKELADKWEGLVSDKVYEAMYNYQVEIDD